MTYYHGTSSFFDIKDYILPPTETGVIRENWRKKNRNYVYVTTSLMSAQKYAKKASEKFGGRPIVYVVAVDEDSLIELHNFEYITKKAVILSQC